MRGETDAQFVSASSTRQFLESGLGFAILRVGSGAGVDERLPEAGTLVITPDGSRLVELARSVSSLSRWTAGPPGIPDDRLEALRAAHDAALADPNLLRDAERLGLPIHPMTGSALAEAVTRALAQPEEVRRLLTSAADNTAEGSR